MNYLTGSCVRLYTYTYIPIITIELGWGRGEACTGFWWGNMRERDHWGDLGVGGRIILRWVFR
jgi:hypothetical protein